MNAAKIAFFTRRSSAPNQIPIHTSSERGTAMKITHTEFWAVVSKALAATTVTQIVTLMLAPGAWAANTEKVLYSFTGGSDGGQPEDALVFDASGNLYGTSVAGGCCGNGTVFELTPNPDGTRTQTVLYSFTGGSDGNRPNAGLVMDKSGALYGTTLLGGSSINGTGVGTVFELQPNGATWTETVLHAFGNGSDGYSPAYSPLLLAANGTLYGATTEGGKPDYGTVYELRPSGGTWKEKILHEFSNNASDGGRPNGGLINGASGTMYGTTLSGGSGSGGTVYALTKSNGGWMESIVNNFVDYSGGIGPIADVTLDKKAGALYGVTEEGGTNYGVVYQLVLP